MRNLRLKGNVLPDACQEIKPVALCATAQFALRLVPLRSASFAVYANKRYKLVIIRTGATATFSSSHPPVRQAGLDFVKIVRYPSSIRSLLVFSFTNHSMMRAAHRQARSVALHAPFIFARVTRR